MAASAAAPQFTPNEWIMVPAVVVKATDAGNVVLSVFDQVVLLNKTDLSNFAMSLGNGTGAGASTDRKGAALNASQDGAFMPIGEVAAAQGSFRAAWDSWQKRKGFRSQ